MLAWPYSRSSWFRSWPPDGRSSYSDGGSRTPSRRPRTFARKIIRLGVPVLISALWAYVCIAVAPNVLNIPFESLGLMDYGVLILLSLALAVFWE